MEVIKTIKIRFKKRSEIPKKWIKDNKVFKRLAFACYVNYLISGYVYSDIYILTVKEAAALCHNLHDALMYIKESKKAWCSDIVNNITYNIKNGEEIAFSIFDIIKCINIIRLSWKIRRYNNCIIHIPDGISFNDLLEYLFIFN